MIPDIIPDNYFSDNQVIIQNEQLHHFVLYYFSQIIYKVSGKIEVIVTFLAILELMKMGRINISQEHIFDDILIESRIAA